MKPRVRWAAAGLCALLLVCVCAAFRWSRPVTLTIGVFAGSNWDVPDPECYAPYHDAIDRFRQLHPNVRIEYVSGIPREDYSEWLAEQMVLGQEPDLFLLPEEDLATLAGLGAMMDLDRMIRADEQVDAAAYYPAAWEAGQVEGTTYALPYECVPKMMFVNETLLAEHGIETPGPDWTWDDLYRICQAVTQDADSDGHTDVYGCIGYTWLDAAVSNGVTPFDPSGKQCAFDDLRLRASIEFYSRLDALTDGRVPDRDAFRKGKAAMQPMRFSSYRADEPYLRKIRRYGGFEWDCLPMPAGPQGDNVCELSTLLFGMSARTDSSTMAWELLRLMTADTDYQCSVCAESSGLSGLRAVVRDYTARAQTDARLALGQVDGAMEKAVARPTFRGYDSVKQHADSAIQSLLASGEDLSGGLLGLQRELTKMLE